MPKQLTIQGITYNFPDKASIADIRNFLNDNGVPVSYPAVREKGESLPPYSGGTFENDKIFNQFIADEFLRKKKTKTLEDFAKTSPAKTSLKDIISKVPLQIKELGKEVTGEQPSFLRQLTPDFIEEMVAGSQLENTAHQAKEIVKDYAIPDYLEKKYPEQINTALEGLNTAFGMTSLPLMQKGPEVISRVGEGLKAGIMEAVQGGDHQYETGGKSLAVALGQDRLNDAEWLSFLLNKAKVPLTPLAIPEIGMGGGTSIADVINKVRGTEGEQYIIEGAEVIDKYKDWTAGEATLGEVLGEAFKRGIITVGDIVTDPINLGMAAYPKASKVFSKSRIATMPPGGAGTGGAGDVVMPLGMRDALNIPREPVYPIFDTTLDYLSGSPSTVPWRGIDPIDISPRELSKYGYRFSGPGPNTEVVGDVRTFPRTNYPITLEDASVSVLPRAVVPYESKLPATMEQSVVPVKSRLYESDIGPTSTKGIYSPQIETPLLPEESLSSLKERNLLDLIETDKRIARKYGVTPEEQPNLFNEIDPRNISATQNRIVTLDELLPKTPKGMKVEGVEGYSSTRGREPQAPVQGELDFSKSINDKPLKSSFRAALDKLRNEKGELRWAKQMIKEDVPREIPKTTVEQMPTDGEIKAAFQKRKPTLLEKIPLVSRLIAIGKDYTTSIESVLRGYGVSGNELADRINLAEKLRDRKTAEWTYKALLNAGKLSKTQIENVIDILDQGSPALDAKTAKVAEDIRKVLNLVKNESELKIPDFEAIENFFPHVFKKEFIDALKNQKPIEELARTLLKKDVNGVQFGDDIGNAIEYIKESMQGIKRRTRFNNLDFARSKNMPGWIRDDLEAPLRAYFKGASKRLSEIEVFGKGDMHVEKLLDDIRDKYGPEAYAEAKQGFRQAVEDVGAITKQNPLEKTVLPFQVLTKLSRAVLGNALQTTNTAIRTSMYDAIKGNLEALALDRKGAKELAEQSGILMSDVMDDITGLNKYADKMLEWTQFKNVEWHNRVATASAGKSYITRLSRQLVKSKNLNSNAAKELRDLKLSPEKILQNKGVTDADILDGIYEIGRDTQFTSGKQHLPSAWTRSPEGRMLTLFKKFAFKQMKFMKESLKRAPIKTAVKTMVLAETVGALVAGAKASEGEREEMGWGEKRIDNLAALSTFGIFYDLIKSAESGSYQLMQFFGGPVISDLAEIGSGIGKTLLKGDSTQLKRSATKRIPIIGRDLQNKLFPVEQ